MIILAIDTAGVDCAAALYDADSDTILSEVTETIGRGHAERLMAIVDQVLDQAKLELEAVGKIGVTVGPGSFTGIRVGVAAARGFALALGVEAVGISTLDVLASDQAAKRAGDTLSDRPILSAIDAKRGEVYLQTYSPAGEPVGEPNVLPLEEARRIAASSDFERVGSGAVLLDGAEVSGEPNHFPIAVVARLTAKSGAGKAKPLYLRGPDAKPQAGFAIARI